MRPPMEKRQTRDSIMRARASCIWHLQKRLQSPRSWANGSQRLYGSSSLTSNRSGQYLICWSKASAFLRLKCFYLRSWNPMLWQNLAVLLDLAGNPGTSSLDSLRTVLGTLAMPDSAIRPYGPPVTTSCYSIANRSNRSCPRSIYQRSSPGALHQIHLSPRRSSLANIQPKSRARIEFDLGDLHYSRSASDPSFA